MAEEITKKAEEHKNEKKKIVAIVRVRGIRNMRPKIKHTLGLLNLNKPNHCVLYPYTVQTAGMIKIIKDYVAYGYITDDAAVKLIVKRGELGSKQLKSDTDASGKVAKSYVDELKSGKGPSKLRDKVDPVFRLRPPRHGYKNIKRHYPLGALGKWDDIDSLILRMI